MKIAGSELSMTSSHSFDTHTTVRSASMEVSAAKSAGTLRGVAALFERSGGSAASAMEQYQRQEQRAAAQERKAQERAGAAQVVNLVAPAQPEATDFQTIFDDMKTSLLDKMLELLRGLKGAQPHKAGELSHGKLLDLRSRAIKTADVRARSFGAGAWTGGAAVPSVGTSSGGTVWQRITATDTFRTEQEQTAFQSRGVAVTEDGRSLEFDVSFSMSRSFTQRYESITTEQILLTDPLMIRLDGSAPSVSGAKFRFDLDCDGQTEEISFAGDGGGFLALDRDGNGRIDDGSELFGPRSGDGFADLAAYDSDGNGWIDENDAVYDDLRVWTRGADGTDTLLTLKEADVGAIYLGSANTEFTLHEQGTHETSAVVRRTGIFLRESGGAGTLSHVDLRC